MPFCLMVNGYANNHVHIRDIVMQQSQPFYKLYFVLEKSVDRTQWLYNNNNKLNLYFIVAQLLSHSGAPRNNISKEHKQF